MEKQTPSIDSRLRHILRMPQEIYPGKRHHRQRPQLKSFVFTTDLAIIRTVTRMPYLPSIRSHRSRPSATHIIKYSYVPVFCGVGGGTTRGGARCSLRATSNRRARWALCSMRRSTI